MQVPLLSVVSERVTPAALLAVTVAPAMIALLESVTVTASAPVAPDCAHREESVKKTDKKTSRSGNTACVDLTTW